MLDNEGWEIGSFLLPRSITHPLGGMYSSNGLVGMEYDPITDEIFITTERTIFVVVSCSRQAEFVH